MVREIMVGNKTEKFGASGALPIVYRDLTGRDFFSDLQGLQSGLTGAVLDMAWAMHRDACPEGEPDMAGWLRQFSFMEINSAIPEIVELLTATQETASEAKKKSGQ